MLFREHRALVLGFNAFLPPGVRIVPTEGTLQEFDHAIDYVTKIKKRFIEEPATYKEFLNILHTYQNSVSTIEEVAERVSVLFKDHRDLLRDFAWFLPESKRGLYTSGSLHQLKLRKERKKTRRQRRKKTRKRKMRRRKRRRRKTRRKRRRRKRKRRRMRMRMGRMRMLMRRTMRKRRWIQRSSASSLDNVRARVRTLFPRVQWCRILWHRSLRKRLLQRRQRPGASTSSGQRRMLLWHRKRHPPPQRRFLLRRITFLLPQLRLLLSLQLQSQPQKQQQRPQPQWLQRPQPQKQQQQQKRQRPSRCRSRIWSYPSCVPLLSA
jgi:hypothetical protein